MTIANRSIDDVLAATEPLLVAEAETPTPVKELVLVAESGDLERTWATLILATSAAASGMRVSIFFTFWGLFPIVRGDVRITGRNPMQRMLSVLQRPGIAHLKLSRFNFAGMGPWMMKRLARQQGVALPPELLELALAMDVKFIPCQMSLDMLGIRRDQLIEGVEEPAGAAAALELMARANASLFI